MEMGLKGKRAIITAASKGIGKAIAFALAEEGAEIAVTSSRKINLDSFAEEFRLKFGKDPITSVMDLDSPTAVKASAAELLSSFGEPDILVNNCGGPLPGNFLDVRDEQWQLGINQVLFSVIELCRLYIPSMKQRKFGRIINITSLTVKQPSNNLVISNTLRAGLTGLAKSLSNELAPFGITVNNIAPGYTLTKRIQELAEHRANSVHKTVDDVLKEMTASIPAGRMASPEEPAALAVFLASKNASYITGNTIHVDGGVIQALW